MARAKKKSKAWKKMEKARCQLLMRYPFFGILSLKLGLTESKHIPTAAVNNTTMYFNPEFIDGLSLDQVIGLNAHEVMHPALGHISRLTSKDPRFWNMAADHVINLMLLQENFVLPDGGLHESRFKDMSADEVYEILMKEAKENGGDGQGQGQGDGSGTSTDDEGNTIMNDQPGFDQMLPPKPGQDTKSSLEEQEGDWKSSVIQAAQSAKQRGHLPAGMERYIEGVLNPVVPWQDELRHFVESKCKNTYTFFPSSRRWLNRGLCLPRQDGLAMGDLVIAVDTSGSCWHALERFASEINSILDLFQPRITVVYCDAEIGDVEVIEPGEGEVEFKMTGGGGTAFEPVFEWVEQEADCDPACMIFFTDMYGSFPKEAPEYPVMWAVVDDWQGEQPFGSMIKIKEESGD
jgi:predicted metal-dependent peptidase